MDFLELAKFLIIYRLSYEILRYQALDLSQEDVFNPGKMQLQLKNLHSTIHLSSPGRSALRPQLFVRPEPVQLLRVIQRADENSPQSLELLRRFTPFCGPPDWAAAVITEESGEGHPIFVLFGIRLRFSRQQLELVIFDED